MKTNLVVCLGMMCMSPLLAAPIFGNDSPEQTVAHPKAREQTLTIERIALANKQLHVLYRPFILAYSHTSIIPSPQISVFNTKPLAFASEAQFRDFQQLLHPQDGSDRPEEKHGKARHFGEVCLMVEITDSHYCLSVDEKGTVRTRDGYYHLNPHGISENRSFAQ